MNWWISAVIIPVITVLLQFFVNYIKDSLNNKKTAKKELVEKQLLELYNHLFIIYLKYIRFLNISWDLEEIEIDGQIGIHKELEVDNFETWNTVIEEVTEKVHQKIHLLEHKDLALWYETEQYLYQVRSEEDLYDAYKCFKRFIKSTVNTYGDLYHEYHLVLRKKKKEKIKILRKEIKNVKKSTFGNKKLKRDKIRRLKKEIKSIKKYGFKKIN
ncbi:hypothetical protein [Bacillus smithii]|uniref:hypothetical protein n=1 Tax=Bacillus smithii TaxID=1479 RepID=UPI003D1F0D53